MKIQDPPLLFVVGTNYKLSGCNFSDLGIIRPIKLTRQGVDRVKPKIWYWANT